MKCLELTQELIDFIYTKAIGIKLQTRVPRHISSCSLWDQHAEVQRFRYVGRQPTGLLSARPPNWRPCGMSREFERFDLIASQSFGNKASQFSDNSRRAPQTTTALQSHISAVIASYTSTDIACKHVTYPVI